MVPQPTPIYHITHKDNLSGIIARGGLIAQSQMTNTVKYCNIAHKNIQDRRSQTPVPCGPGGFIHDYVPFYFAPRSPMLYAIHMGNVDGCTADQKDIVYLVANAQRVDSMKLDYVFTDGHGVVAISDFYESLNDLDNVDWAIMRAKYWRDTLEDPDRKRRRQAEFLVYMQFAWDLFDEIGVINKTVKTEVGKIIANASSAPLINIRSNWYY